ncbi:hypothetical protein BCR33DRAFT_734147 [Rhizoclosmatium globosum]|uniref:S-adenosyl-L-methionine-dependent methyltransferase n=1 Tax=Rhizoclosmatium globosum TaxID=329046 RepID=A0A1Y2CW19_9FUNG|nr:hypothetical protein BCR33DRAFT_734147 [Rhizoclosmatium globosum]|eukprot:ORY51004.1 hypothetical protein BCR33DRAFT_734147 [Rhizoclosmatium globosum]
MAMRFDTPRDLRWFCTQTGLSETAAIERLTTAREKTRETLHVYKCVEELMFGTPRADSHPAYETIKHQFSNPSFTVLELGCCYGTDARKMISDGLASSNLTVSDLHSAYFDIGETVLFAGCPPVTATKVWGDLAVPVSTTDVVATNNLQSAFNAVSAQAILHVFTFQQSSDFLAQIHRCLKPNGILFGTCVAAVSLDSTPAVSREWGVIPTKGLENRTEGTRRYLHSRDSLTKLLTGLGFTNVVVEEEKWQGSSAQHQVGEFDQGGPIGWLLFSASK